MDEPFPDGAAELWQELLGVVIDRRVRVYESLLPLYISTIWSRYRAAVPGSGQRHGVARRRKRLRPAKTCSGRALTALNLQRSRAQPAKRLRPMALPMKT